MIFGKNYSTIDRRLTARLMLYWQDICAGRSMPMEADLSPQLLGPDWDYCFLLRARDVLSSTNYSYTYLGNNILALYLDKTVDAHNGGAVGPNANAVDRHFKTVLETSAPLLDEGELGTTDGRRVLYRQIFLPVGREQGPVEAVFGGMNYKIVAE